MNKAPIQFTVSATSISEINRKLIQPNSLIYESFETSNWNPLKSRFPNLLLKIKEIFHIVKVYFSCKRLLNMSCAFDGWWRNIFVIVNKKTLPFHSSQCRRFEVNSEELFGNFTSHSRKSFNSDWSFTIHS